ncbi:MAG: hypothetical protein AAFR35_00565 [Pseudomonadota bacterium]
MTGASAHEVQPAVADLNFEGRTVSVVVRMALEAPVAGIDLQGLFDTNEAENSESYDTMRALDPLGFENEVRGFWPTMADKITLRAGETEIELALAGVEVPEVGNVELPRTSTLRLEGALPRGSEPVVFGWTGDLGALVIRDVSREDGYTGFVTNGGLSDPIERRAGGVFGGVRRLFGD